MENSLTVLLVEDDAKECGDIIACAQNNPNITLIGVTNNTTKALDTIKNQSPDAVILDLELHSGNGNGLILLKELFESSMAFMPYILITTNNSSKITHKSAREFGADFIMPKYKEDYSAQAVVDFLCMMKSIIQSSRVLNNSNLTYEYISAEEKSRRLICKISKELDLIGISTKVTGYRYLIDAIEIVTNAPCKNLCNIIGEKYGKTAPSVERAMQNAISKAWRTTPIDDLLSLYTAKINSERGVPTINEFIYYYANKIKHQQGVR